jgi:hypothetical protein
VRHACPLVAAGICRKVYFKEAKVVDSSDDAKSFEGRRSPRIRTFLKGRVSYGDGAISTVCTVNQLSDVGARINIASGFSLPETFDVVIPQRGISRRAKLIWRRDDQAGVDFVDGEDDRPTGPIDPAIRTKALEAENAKLKALISILQQQVNRLTEE